jgi:hypothetical protein
MTGNSRKHLLRPNPAANSTLEDILFPAVVLAEKEEEGEEGKGQGVGPSVYENAGGPDLSRLGWSVPLQILWGQKTCVGQHGGRSAFGCIIQKTQILLPNCITRFQLAKKVF